MERMPDVAIATNERMNVGTAWTRNEQMERDGYLKVDNLCNPLDLYHPCPRERGVFNYHSDDVNHFEFKRSTSLSGLETEEPVSSD